MHNHPTSQRGIAPYLITASATGLALLTIWGVMPATGNPKPPTPKPAASLKELTFADLSGKVYGNPSLAARKATVFLFVSGQCPISNVYTPRFAAFAAACAPRNVQVFGVYSDRQESPQDAAKHARLHGLAFPIVKDKNNALADRLGATMTPEVVIVDAAGTVRYRGRFDDNAVSTKVATHDAADALDAVLDGKPVAHPQQVAFGCAIRRAASPALAVAGAPTYAREVAPILRAKCENCHRPGQVAPFSLQNYTQASAWASDIKKYTQNRQMPPWKPAPGYGEFQDEAHINLTDAERVTLAKWADAGAPLGNAKQIPPPAHFSTQEWKLGQPDVILEPDRDFHLAADGDDVFRNYVVKTNFTEDKWIAAVECQPGNKAVVHHIVNYIDARHNADAMLAKTHDGEPGFASFGGPGFVPSGLLSGWAPGNDPHFLPEGIGTKVPKGSNIVIQVHYHKNGQSQTDRPKIGLYFARTPVDKEAFLNLTINFAFRVPAGDSHYETTALTRIKQDCHLLSVMPHMHLLGRSMKIWAKLPDGTEKPLVWIKDWDYNWQATYMLKEPMALPKGTELHVIADYDNSSDNPRNPNRAHPKDVTWGEQTTDEMCVAFYALTRDNEHLVSQPANTQQTASNSH